MQLSKRLQAIASMIPEGKRVIDIGCDHAFLDIYLTLSCKNECIASDVNPNVLLKTNQMISSYQLEKKIQVVQSDGFDSIELKKNDIGILAGMGTSTILRIVKRNSPDHLIVQSNNELELLRTKMKELGFFILKERAVYEKKVYYVMIEFQKGIRNYTKLELRYGPMLLQNKEDVTISYWKNLLFKKESVLKKIPTDIGKRKKILEEIRELKTIIEKSNPSQ